MRLPRFRLTVQLMMVWIVFAALASRWCDGVIRARRADFAYRAVIHSQRSYRPAYHARMAAKYEWASRYPWLPVWP